MLENRPVAGPGASADGRVSAEERRPKPWHVWWERAAARLRAWQAQRRDRRLLSRFIRRELADIGLSAADPDLRHPDPRREAESRWWRV